MNPNIEKKGLHPRNKHKNAYDFDALSNTLPELKSFITINKYGNASIDFANPKAVKALNKALLKYFYGIDNWDIPPAYLCPPIPGRAEYVHHIADVLYGENLDTIPNNKQIRILDIGVGANCIYPIIGHQAYGWHFIGADIDKVAIQSAEKIVADNPVLENAIECRLQISSDHIFKNIILPADFFDCTMCNPPFHTSLKEATKGTQRKLHNLGKQKNGKTLLNFGGQNSELWCMGGEIAFITKMILESSAFKSQCIWFSSLVSKSENLKKIYFTLKSVNVFEVKTIHTEIGNKMSRIVFWTFWKVDEREMLIQENSSNKKT